MRRLVSLVLAIAVTLSVALAGGISVSAESSLTPSDECINILKKYEGFSAKPYRDYGQWTVGYGTRCPADKLEQYQTYGITQEEAEALLRDFVSAYGDDVNSFADKYSLTLTQNQFDALLLFSFNCGSGWVYSPGWNFHKTMAQGSEADAQEVLYWFATWSNAGGSPNTALIRRRICEADMYLNGNYSVVTPAHYGYVIYDAAGGEVTSRIHAYDSDLGATPIVPTYEGHTFMGWFSEKTGGYQVTALGESTDGETLYARWDDAGYTDEEAPTDPSFETIEALTITVTSNGVNLRKGPGTNYATVGQANKGDKFTITKIAEGSGLTWGGFDSGWVCLNYTNYESVKDGTAEPEPSEPEETQPEQTGKLTGKVKANGGLNVRSGPGTGYGVVAHLSNGAAVEILEQKSVGATVWGKISSGWISMSYVVLDSEEEEEPETTEPAPSEPTEPAEPTEPTEPSEPDTDDSVDQSGTIIGYIKANGGLNVRSGPGTTYSIVGGYSNGDKVTVTQQQTVGSTTWGKTEKGWISMNYFTTDAYGDSGTTTQPQSKQGTIKVDGSLNIRSGPGTTYAVCGYYNNGARVTILEQKTVGAMVWGKTEKGWISMSYVALDDSQGSESQPTTITKTITASCLNVRSGAGTGYSVVGYLYAGAKVEILEQKTVNGQLWGKISTGWISMEYTA